MPHSDEQHQADDAQQRRQPASSRGTPVLGIGMGLPCQLMAPTKLAESSNVKDSQGLLTRDEKIAFNIRLEGSLALREGEPQQLAGPEICEKCQSGITEPSMSGQLAKHIATSGCFEM